MSLPILLARSFSALAALTLFATSDANAGRGLSDWVYSAPFVCGSSPGSAGLAEGSFVATLSLMNPGPRQRVRIRVALTAPSDIDTTAPVVRSLDRFEASQLGCRQLLSDTFFDTPLPSTPPFAGFVIVEAQDPIEVSVAQSVTGPDGDVSFSTTSIDGRMVLRPRVAAAKRSVEICHIPPGNPRNRHTIVVDADAVSAHLGHGDQRGECDHDDDDDEDDDD